jgi:hypothetical protein
MRCLLCGPDTAVIHGIFLSGFQGDATAVRKLIESSSVSPDHYIRPLLRISTDNADAQLLRVCFENGFAADDYNRSEHLLSSCVRNKPSTEWLDVLYDFDYRQWRTNSQQLGEWRTWRHVLFMGADCTRWWLAHGGRTPRARSLFEYSEKHWPGAPTIRILFDQFGIDWFKDSGTLQLAAENQDIETVKMLVEAGADVNEEVTDWHVDYREGGKGPLPALHMAVYAKSEEVIRYLAEHGARLERGYITDRYKTLPKEYRPFMDLVNDLGAVKEETSL